MEHSESKLLQNLRAFSRYCILAGIFTTVISLPFGGIPIAWQVALALIALTVGIPHGAVDHLITVPKFASLKMAAFLLGYLAVVGLAIWAMLSSNLLGFQLVVLMSAIHFGLGDAAFISELNARSRQVATDRKVGKFPKIPYLVASGFMPVVVPLVSGQSTQALAAVNPKLIDWAGGLAPALFVLMLVVGVVSIAWMLAAKRPQEALDLALLLTLTLVTPPLVAFAFYFGLWHALRHTGRISLEYKKSKEQHKLGKSGRAFWSAVWAGAPALAIVLGFTGFLGLTNSLNLSQQFLWYLLVVIWALTVPHMALTLRLDVKALGR
ncbi:MAG: Brp/Blh family beta-carotene 15,15'-dioxygenase [Micrococcales bacterium]